MGRYSLGCWKILMIEYTCCRSLCGFRRRRKLHPCTDVQPAYGRGRRVTRHELGQQSSTSFDKPLQWILQIWSATLARVTQPCHEACAPQALIRAVTLVRIQCSYSIAPLCIKKRFRKTGRISMLKKAHASCIYDQVYLAQGW